MNDYYKILGIEKTASKEDIKAAYKKLARKYHPDLNPNNKNAENKFKELSNAYEIIGDEKKRQEYDQGGPSFRGAEGPGQDRSYYSRTQNHDSARYKDIFREMFEGYDFEQETSAHTRRRPRTSKGEDILYSMEVNFEDSILGAEKTFTTPDGKNISVKIPAGFNSGQKLRLSGIGGMGHAGGAKGDMYIQIEVRPSQKYLRDGKNVEVEIPLLFSTAILGGVLRVPTVDGEVELTIPKGVSSGTKLRVKGKGVRIPGNPGDLFAKIKITVPKKVDPELEQAIKTWQKKKGGQL